MKKILCVLLIIVGLPLLWIVWWPPFYMAKSIEGQVIDADTGQPVQSVIITVNWQLTGGIWASMAMGQMNIMETTTDENGRFKFPPWGPKLRPLFTVLLSEPQLIFFKEGYEFIKLQNGTRSRPGKMISRDSKWDKQVIKMKKFQGNLNEYARHLEDLGWSLEWAYTEKECEWKEIPQMVAALHEYALYLKSQNVPSDLYTIDKLIPYEGFPDKCEAREYLRRYKK